MRLSPSVITDPSRSGPSGSIPPETVLVATIVFASVMVQKLCRELEVLRSLL